MQHLCNFDLEKETFRLVEIFLVFCENYIICGNGIIRKLEPSTLL